jgi:hypothetical protein
MDVYFIRYVHVFVEMFGLELFFKDDNFIFGLFLLDLITSVHDEGSLLEGAIFEHRIPFRVTYCSTSALF